MSAEFSSLVMQTKPIDDSDSHAITEWSEWSPCSSSCGFGVRSRSRKCVDPSVSCTKYLNDLQLCKGNESCASGQNAVTSSYSFTTTTSIGESSSSQSSTTTTNANNESTRVETTGREMATFASHWSSWSSWSECSASCNEKGMRIRKRYCIQRSDAEEGCRDSDPVIDVMNCTQTKCGSDYICTFDHSSEPFCRYQLMNTGNYSFELVSNRSQTKYTGPVSDYPTKSKTPFFFTFKFFCFFKNIYSYYFF